tara:strand:+ start:2445 stop:3794 length:1350 start_codon:yes stop_codon:yes gene_type:complete
MKFTFFDTETTGLQTRFDYALTFSAKTYDQSFTLIDEINLQTGLKPGLIPSIFALATNKLKITDLRNSNMSYFEMTREIHNYLMKHTPSYIIGHNSLSFDREILRSQFYQCLLPVYICQTMGNQEADSLHLARSAYTFSPTSLKVSMNDKGKPDFRLESLSSANQLDHTNAHEAESDVLACVGLLNKIKKNDPKFFEDCLQMTSKKGIEQFINQNLVFCHSPFYDQKLLLTNCLKYGSGYFIYDLKFDPDDYLDLSAKELAKIVRKKSSPFYFIKNNKMPILLDLSYIKYIQYDISEEMLFERAQKIRANKSFKDALQLAADLTEKDWPEGATVEEKIFSGGFPEQFDQNLMKVFHNSDWNERAIIASHFEDPRFTELANRLIFEENRSLLSANVINQVEKDIHNKLHVNDNQPRSLHQAIADFETFKEKNPGVDSTPLTQYEQFLKAI